MAGDLSLSGSLLGKPSVESDATIPSAIVTLPFSIAKTFSVTSGAQSTALSSPNAYVVLGGIDATAGTVKRANTLYLRTNAKMDVRLTQAGDVDPTVLELLGVKGLFILELDDTRAGVGLAVRGTGTVEWFACGAS